MSSMTGFNSSQVPAEIFKPFDPNVYIIHDICPRHFVVAYISSCYLCTGIRYDFGKCIQINRNNDTKPHKCSVFKGGKAIDSHLFLCERNVRNVMWRVSIQYLVQSPVRGRLVQGHLVDGHVHDQYVSYHGNAFICP